MGFARPIAIFAALSMAFIAVAAEEQDLSDVELANRGKKSTVLVELGQEKGYGSAFCVDGRGYYLTNNHVINGAGGAVKLIVDPGHDTQKIITAKVVRTDDQLDLALLKCDENAAGVAAIELGTDQGLTELQEVLAYGFPFGKDLALNPGDYPSISINKGRVTALRMKSGKLNRVQIDAVLNPGNSGGPILNKKGQVIGVVVSGVIGAGAVNFGIPVSHARAFLHKPEVKVTAPELTDKNLHSEVQFKVAVNSFFAAKYEINLALSHGAEKRILKPSLEDNGEFIFKFVPVAEQPRTFVALSAAFTSGSISGRILDHAVSIAGKTVQLSEVQSISPQAGAGQGEVVLNNGDKLSGVPAEIAAMTIDAGETSIRADLSRAASISIKRPDSGAAQLSYTLAINYEGTTDEITGAIGVDSPDAGGAAGAGAGEARESSAGPTPMAGATAEVKLPSTICDVAVGGGGRYLILYLDKLHKLAIFDANKGEIAKYISVPENILFSAGQTKLIVLVKDNNIVQRYSLETFERELSVQLPVPGVVQAICMGSASEGPLFTRISPGTEALDRVSYHLLDIQKMTSTPVKFKNNDPMGMFCSYRDVIHYRAAADGTAFGCWSTSGSPNGVGLISLSQPERGEVNAYYVHESRGHVMPSADGSRIYTHGNIFTNELKKLKPEQQNQQNAIAYLPAYQSAYYFGISVPMYNANEHAKKDMYLFEPGSDKTIITIPAIENTGVPQPWGKDDFTLDKRYYFLMKSNVIITIPEQNDRLALTRFNLVDALKNANIDYLFVSSVPPRVATRNKAWKYKIDVESRQGDVKFALDSGPKDMTLSADGVLTWTPPADCEKDIGVIVGIHDKSGQDYFHSFSIKVP